MTETKWTPGPWTMDAMMDDHPGHQPRVFAGRKAVAGVGNGEDWATAKPEWIANAHLIAAAPELYEATAFFVRMADATGHTGTAVDKARAALAKARGET